MLGVHEVFAGVVRRFGDRIAVSDQERELTYLQLDTASTRLAGRLADAGAGRGVLVGLCAARGVDLIVAMLAVAKTGAGYVPLDPSHPPARLAATIADAGCPIMLADSCWAEAFPTVPTFVTLDAAAAAEPGAGSFIPATVSPADVAYVIYTSGSTGVPKGVRVTHHNLNRLVTASDRLFDFGPDDVWTMFHSAAFDFSVWEIYGALLHGAHLIVVPYATTRDPDAMWQLVRDRSVTVLNQTPTAFANLAAAAAASGYPPTRLRYVIFGGEALRPSTLTAWVDHYGTEAPHLINMYGITETTVHVTHHRITAADLTRSVSPIGRPLPDLTVELRDPDGNPVPDGRPGEMYVAGPGVSLGYHHQPAQTAQRFLPAPTGPAGERLYRTGDLATRESDGTFRYHGRTDQQIKLRGFRIEPREIEHILQLHPLVHATHVSLTADPDQPYLTGHLTLTPGASDDHGTLQAIRAHLGRHLPSHMIPKHLSVHAHLPTTPNGKFDLAQLPTPTVAGPVGAGPCGSPRQEQLREVWQRVLGMARIDLDDNFFTVGGDSIVAVQLVAQLRASGLDAGIELLYFHPTVRELAGALTAAAPPVAPARFREVSVALPAGVEAAYPTASIQLGILFHCDLVEDAGLYHDLTSVRVEAPWDEAAMEDALAVICARHEIIRTTFDLAGFDEPVQLVQRTAVIPLVVDDLAGLGRDAQDDFLRTWWERESAKPFDLAVAPLVRAHVGLRSAGSFQLSLSVHHVLVDGWSFARLMTEVLVAYDRRLGGEPAGLPDLPPVRYRDFVAAEQEMMASEPARAYWSGLLAGAPAMTLPWIPAETDSPATVAEVLPAQLSRAAQRAADTLGVPVKAVYAAAYLWALGALTGSADVTGGLCTNGRPEVQGSELVLGVFLNVVPLRIAVAGQSWAALICAVFAQEREQLPFRVYPLARIQHELGRMPFDAVFNYTDFHAFGALNGLARVTADDWSFADRTSFPAAIEVNRRPQDGSVELSVHVDPNQMSPGTGQRIAVLLRGALEHLAADGVHAPLP